MSAKLKPIDKNMIDKIPIQIDLVFRIWENLILLVTLICLGDLLLKNQVRLVVLPDLK